MRNWILAAGLVTVASATPERTVEEHERYLGSSEAAHAVVRVVTDNLGSHYSTGRKTYLDEYRKSDGERTSSILILDLVHHLDTEHNDPNTPPAVEKKVVEKNTTLLWSEVLEKYDVQMAGPSRQPAWRNRLRWDYDGLFFDDDRLVLPQGTLAKDHGLEVGITVDDSGKLMDASFPGSIEDLTYDGGWIYLQLGLMNQDIDESSSKVVPLPPDVTRRILSWASMEETYLRLGTHDSLEAANAGAWAVMMDCRARDVHGVSLEIWERRTERGGTEFLVVDEFSKTTIRDNKVESLEKKIGRKLVPVSNQGFVQRWDPIAPKLPGDVTPALTE